MESVPRHADGGGPVDHRDHAVPVGRATGVQMGVRIHQRRRKGFRRRWQLVALAFPAGHHLGWIGAKSGPVSASFGSSFANSGVGLSSGRPTSIGTDSQWAFSTV